MGWRLPPPSLQYENVAFGRESPGWLHFHGLARVVSRSIEEKGSAARLSFLTAVFLPEVCGVRGLCPQMSEWRLPPCETLKI